MGGLSRILCLLLATAVPSAAADSRHVERVPRFGRTLVLPNAQVKYPLHGNYTRRWVDRPLLLDTSLRVEGAGWWAQPAMDASFRRTIDTVLRYGLDGLSYFVENGPVSFAALDMAERAGVPGFSLVPNWGTINVEEKDRFFEAARNAKTPLRLDGKIVVVSYMADLSGTPADWAKTLGMLRQKHGDAFLFMADITQPASQYWSHWAEQWRAGKLTDTDREALNAYLRSWLDVVDGLHYQETHMRYTAERTFDEGFYREFVIPLYQGVLAEPKYQGKLFGLSASISHVNCTLIGRGLEEDGTKTLRRSFEAAMDARPDLIQMMEWDEQNENTSIRPTVDNGWSTQRILACYMRRLKGEPPAPNPGDDRRIPNLIISYRKLVILGERLQVEVLNVPDSQAAGRQSVSLALKDARGKVVKRFPSGNLPTETLSDVTFTLPTQESPDCPSFAPRCRWSPRTASGTSSRKGYFPFRFARPGTGISNGCISRCAT